jgi:hypothetical protein
MDSLPRFFQVSVLAIAILGVCAIAAGNASDSTKTRAESVATKVTVTTGGRVDVCLSCHKDRPDKAHGRDVLGCSPCHKGNPLAGDKDQAHRGMIFNPGELGVADETCGQSGCHTSQVHWVKNSLMATNRGILTTLRYYWGESADHNEDISVEMLMNTGMDSRAIQYFRKLCGSCHLWMERKTLPGFLADKGGGCTACHLTPNEEGVPEEERHPQLVRSVPIENCVRCHNRSGRIGLSYQGQYESEGYGTPFEDGEFSSQELVDGRFYQVFPEDVHHKTGLACVDCHTQRETMGDGTKHAHFEQQLEVTCRTCHGDREALSAMAETAALPIPLPPLKPLAEEGGSFKYPRLNVTAKDGDFFLKGKKDEKLHPLHAPNPQACGHETHRRLSCQACHSTWVPQCYGCHVRMDGSKVQLDKVAVKETAGLWEEFKSFMRRDCPPLGILEDQEDASGHRAEGGSPAPGTGEVVVMVPG